MKICLIGEFSGTPDEGMKNISRTVANRLAARHDVFRLETRDVRTVDGLMRLRRFSPQIIHYLHGPTIRSLLILKGLRRLCGDCRVVVSATRPYFSTYSAWAIPFLRPHLIFTQSEKFESFFKSKGCEVCFIPNGVDCAKFAPVDKERKIELRKKLGWPEDKKIVLHVGHIKENRQLSVFEKIQQIDTVQVVIVGGTAQKADEALKMRLEGAEIMVLHRYFEDVSEIYKAADMYVFPIIDTSNALPNDYNQVGAIDLPLSVLEAMACNLPVVTTRFGALPRLFEEGRGFFYADGNDGIIDRVCSMEDGLVSGTRKMIEPYDWDAVVERIEGEYRRLLQ